MLGAAVVCRFPLAGEVEGRLSAGGPAASRLAMGDAGLGQGYLAALVASGPSVGVCGVPIAAASRDAEAMVRDGRVPLSSSDSRCTAPAPCPRLRVAAAGPAGMTADAEVQAVSGRFRCDGAFAAAAVDDAGGVRLWRAGLSLDKEAPGAAPNVSVTASGVGWQPDSEGFGQSFASVDLAAGAELEGAPLCAATCHFESRRAHILRAGPTGAIEVVRSFASTDAPLASVFLSSQQPGKRAQAGAPAAPESPAHAAAAGLTPIAVAEGGCVSLFDPRVSERGGRVARVTVINGGGRVASLHTEAGLLLAAGTGSLVRVLDPRSLRSVGRWTAPAKAGIRAVRIAGAPWAATKAASAPGAATAQALAFAAGGDSDVFSGLIDVVSLPAGATVARSARAVGVPTAADRAVSDAGPGADGGAAQPSSAATAARAHADVDDVDDEDDVGADGEPYEPEEAPPKRLRESPPSPARGAAEPESGSARPERKAVGSGPPGGATGRLGLRQSSGYRGAAAWAGIDVPVVPDWSETATSASSSSSSSSSSSAAASGAAAGLPARSRRVLATLGDDGALWVVADPSNMLPSAILPESA
ncbi:hypothetical protein FNF31_00764 [Cafeteria roenbergensis]|uniref:Uncharacterized protein n=1 Tax=Cafeteria roenbergensis TaxID=33653 RepID=A0A5A8E2R6_CAFRO|nr:hypothetical protein FNF31_00764 [Cafeteria roenbergensis]KAA0171628.1 hypothetical protein FNF28_00561 [Cafeteria roenbergensis]